MAARLNSVTSKGPLNRAHTYKAAVVATSRPDATPTTATRSRRAGRDRCFDDGSSRRHEVRRPTRHASGGTRQRRASRQHPTRRRLRPVRSCCFDEPRARSSSRAWISPLGHSLGQTRPYWAVSGPSPLARDATGYYLFPGTFGPDAATNAMLHTREDAGSKPAAPIRKGADLQVLRRRRRATAPRPRFGVSSRSNPIARDGSQMTGSAERPLV
jgi:hypothetical protein